MSSKMNNYVRKNLPAGLSKWGFILLGVGLVMAVIAYNNNPLRASFASLIGFMFLLSIGLGSLFLVALEYLAGATWSVPFIRIAEILSTLVIIAPILAIPVLLNMHDMYEWTNKAVVDASHALTQKKAYLDINFFYIRFVSIISLLGLFYYIFTKNSLKQDITGDQKLTTFNVKLSALFMPVFAIGLSLLAIDFMMSLEPKWFSTIYGVYYFAGSFWVAIALITLFAVNFNEKGLLGTGINKDHYYSLGALMFAFTAFWTYIAFSQFMLIWYANLPEETFWFIPRMTGGWGVISIGLIVTHFVVPFFMLIQRPSKTNPSRLKLVATMVLAFHIYDLYWLIYPTYSRIQSVKQNDASLISSPFFGWIEISYIILALGILLTVFSFVGKGKNLIPIGDPKLKRAMDFHL
ncbi:MAG: quinol:cytochrome C oxidoreductase [Candidatus Kapabacteria bacterium]|nr:quinol:cytochrome C oxidoreductase [Candidatus Kapabacteria bacterium]